MCCSFYHSYNALPILLSRLLLLYPTLVIHHFCTSLCVSPYLKQQYLYSPSQRKKKIPNQHNYHSNQLIEQTITTRDPQTRSTGWVWLNNWCKFVTKDKMSLSTTVLAVKPEMRRGTGHHLNNLV